MKTRAAWHCPLCFTRKLEFSVTAGDEKRGAEYEALCCWVSIPRNVIPKDEDARERMAQIVLERIETLVVEKFYEEAAKNAQGN